MGLFTQVIKKGAKVVDGLLDDAAEQSEEIKKLSPEEAEEWLRRNPRPGGSSSDPEVTRWYKRRYRAGATGKQSTEVDWNEEAWIAANPRPDFGGVRVKDLNEEQTREWKRWHSRKGAAKHKSRVRDANAQYYRDRQDYIKSQQAEYREKTRDARNAEKRERYANDPEYKNHILGKVKEYHDRMPEDVKQAKAELSKQNLAKRIARMTPDELAEYRSVLAANSSNRRAAILKATPPWANQDEIQEIYRISQDLTQLTGEPYDVDHIVPLLGYSGQRANRTASGLHTQDNLLVVPKLDNLSKGAKFEPGSEVEPGGVDAARGLLYEAMDELGLLE